MGNAFSEDANFADPNYGDISLDGSSTYVSTGNGSSVVHNRHVTAKQRNMMMSNANVADPPGSLAEAAADHYQKRRTPDDEVQTQSSSGNEYQYDEAGQSKSSQNSSQKEGYDDDTEDDYSALTDMAQAGSGTSNDASKSITTIMTRETRSLASTSRFSVANSAGGRSGYDSRNPPPSGSRVGTINSQHSATHIASPGSQSQTYRTQRSPSPQQSVDSGPLQSPHIYSSSSKASSRALSCTSPSPFLEDLVAGGGSLVGSRVSGGSRVGIISQTASPAGTVSPIPVGNQTDSASVAGSRVLCGSMAGSRVLSGSMASSQVLSGSVASSRVANRSNDESSRIAHDSDGSSQVAHASSDLSRVANGSASRVASGSIVGASGSIVGLTSGSVTDRVVGSPRANASPVGTVSTARSHASVVSAARSRAISPTRSRASVTSALSRVSQTGSRVGTVSSAPGQASVTSGSRSLVSKPGSQLGAISPISRGSVTSPTISVGSPPGSQLGATSPGSQTNHPQSDVVSPALGRTSIASPVASLGPPIPETARVASPSSSRVSRSRFGPTSPNSGPAHGPPSVTSPCTSRVSQTVSQVGAISPASGRASVASRVSQVVSQIGLQVGATSPSRVHQANVGTVPTSPAPALSTSTSQAPSRASAISPAPSQVSASLKVPPVCVSQTGSQAVGGQQAGKPSFTGEHSRIEAGSADGGNLPKDPSQVETLQHMPKEKKASIAGEYGDDGGQNGPSVFTSIHRLEEQQQQLKEQLERSLGTFSSLTYNTGIPLNTRDAYTRSDASHHSGKKNQTPHEQLQELLKQHAEEEKRLQEQLEQLQLLKQRKERTAMDFELIRESAKISAKQREKLDAPEESSKFVWKELKKIEPVASIDKKIEPVASIDKKIEPVASIDVDGGRASPATAELVQDDKPVGAKGKLEPEEQLTYVQQDICYNEEESAYSEVKKEDPSAHGNFSVADFSVSVKSDRTSVATERSTERSKRQPQNLEDAENAEPVEHGQKQDTVEHGQKQGEGQVKHEQRQQLGKVQESARVVLRKEQPREQILRKQQSLEQETSPNISPSPTGDDDIDLEFVEKYDNAFNHFLGCYPEFFDKSADLIQNLKVAKLQKMLEVTDQVECELVTHLETSQQMKTTMEEEYQKKLRDASRKKAARTIQLQSDLSQLRQNYKVTEGKLTWEMVTMAMSRAVKLNNLKQQLQNLNVDTKRENLSALLTDTQDSQAIREAMLAPPVRHFGGEEMKEYQQLQVDNGFLKAEVTVLQKKLAYQKFASKKHAWVDSVLLRMDSKKLRKLKHRYQKKLGVNF